LGAQLSTMRGGASMVRLRPTNFPARFDAMKDLVSARGSDSPRKDGAVWMQPPHVVSIDDLMSAA
jgi:hypothetical protein